MLHLDENYFLSPLIKDEEILTNEYVNMNVNVNFLIFFLLYDLRSNDFIPRLRHNRLEMLSEETDIRDVLVIHQIKLKMNH